MHKGGERHRIAAQPSTLVARGKNDPLSTIEGAKAYARDMPGRKMHILDAGHLALEEEAPKIAELMLEFLGRRVFSEARR